MSEFAKDAEAAAVSRMQFRTLADRLEPIIGELEIALTLRAGLMDSESRRDEVLRTLRASIASAVAQLKAISEPESL